MVKKPSDDFSTWSWSLMPSSVTLKLEAEARLTLVGVPPNMSVKTITPFFGENPHTREFARNIASRLSRAEPAVARELEDLMLLGVETHCRVVLDLLCAKE